MYQVQGIREISESHQVFHNTNITYVLTSMLNSDQTKFQFIARKSTPRGN